MKKNKRSRLDVVVYSVCAVVIAAALVADICLRPIPECQWPFYKNLGHLDAGGILIQALFGLATSFFVFSSLTNRKHFGLPLEHYLDYLNGRVFGLTEMTMSPLILMVLSIVFSFFDLNLALLATSLVGATLFAVFCIVDIPFLIGTRRFLNKVSNIIYSKSFKKTKPGERLSRGISKLTPEEKAFFEITIVYREFTDGFEKTFQSILDDNIDPIQLMQLIVDYEVNFLDKASSLALDGNGNLSLLEVDGIKIQDAIFMAYSNLAVISKYKIASLVKADPDFKSGATALNEFAIPLRYHLQLSTLVEELGLFRLERKQLGMLLRDLQPKLPGDDKIPFCRYLLITSIRSINPMNSRRKITWFLEAILDFDGLLIELFSIEFPIGFLISACLYKMLKTQYVITEDERHEIENFLTEKSLGKNKLGQTWNCQFHCFVTRFDSDKASMFRLLNSIFRFSKDISEEMEFFPMFIHGTNEYRSEQFGTFDLFTLWCRLALHFSIDALPFENISEKSKLSEEERNAVLSYMDKEETMNECLSNSDFLEIFYPQWLRSTLRRDPETEKQRLTNIFALVKRWLNDK